MARMIHTAAMAGVPGLKWKVSEASLAPSLQGRLAPTDRRCVDLAECRGTAETLPENMNPTPMISLLDPSNVTVNDVVFMVGEKNHVVVRTRIQGLGDRTDTGCLILLRCPKIRMADPTDEDFTHARSVITFIV